MRGRSGLGCLLLVAAGCGNLREEPPDAPGPAREIVDVALPAEHELDLLFVIDNSSGTLAGQAQLVAHVDALVNAIAATGVVPDLHIGVVTSDLGALGVDLGDPACGAGDAGHLRTSPELTDSFLSDIRDPVSGTRTRNYSGTLTEAFASIAEVGDLGCGFEQHLEAMRTALVDLDGANAGFLRPTAQLAVLVAGDEDDCSARNPDFFGPESPALGPLDSFRCFEHGVVCDHADLRAEGIKTSCAPREDSTYLHGVQRYVDYLRELRPGGRVTLHAVAADVEPVEVGRKTVGAETRPDLLPSCSYCEVALDASGNCPDPANNVKTADAGIRLDAFVRGFAARGGGSRWCQTDYTAGLVDFGSRIHANLVGQPCLRGTPTTASPTCSVELTTYGETATALADCDAGATNPPCWRFVTDALACSGTPSQLRLDVVGVADAPGRRVTATCDVVP